MLDPKDPFSNLSPDNTNLTHKVSPPEAPPMTRCHQIVRFTNQTLRKPDLPLRHRELIVLVVPENGQRHQQEMRQSHRILHPGKLRTDPPIHLLKGMMNPEGRMINPATNLRQGVMNLETLTIVQAITLLRETMIPAEVAAVTNGQAIHPPGAADLLVTVDPQEVILPQDHPEAATIIITAVHDPPAGVNPVDRLRFEYNIGQHIKSFDVLSFKNTP